MISNPVRIVTATEQIDFLRRLGYAEVLDAVPDCLLGASDRARRTTPRASEALG